MNTFAIVSHTGKRIHSEECQERRQRKYAKGYFKCIDCAQEVHVRRGDKRAWHFCHYSEKHGSMCPHANGGETKEHYECKHWIAQNLHRCAFAVEKCPCCSRKRFFVARSAGTPVYIHKDCRAEVECKIPGTSRVADVACILKHSGNVVIAAIEVFHTHETCQEKREACTEQGVALLEVTTDEVQRHSKTKKGLHDLVQLRTTCMKQVHCPECVMLRAWQLEMETLSTYEAWHDGMWNMYGELLAAQRKDAKREGERKMKLREGAWQLQMKKLSAYEAWHDEMWEMYGELLAAQRKDARRPVKRKMKIRKGSDMAHAKIQEMQLNSIAKPRQKQGRCVGKCKQCKGWMFDGQDLCEIESGTMSVASWNELFEGEPQKYRKRYELGDEYNTVTIHKTCSIQCVSCGDQAFLHMMARFGMCFYCCSLYKKSSPNESVEQLRSRWARRWAF
jgi:hypothetical protein